MTQHTVERTAKVYLRGTVHYLSPADAAAKYPAGALCEHRLESDGTISVYQLSSAPIQRGQPQWVRRAAPSNSEGA